MKLIPLDALVAEIERLRKKNNESENVYDFGTEHALKSVLSIIDTLEVKEVDLEKEIDLVEDKYRGFESLSRADIIAVAKHFFEFGLSVSNSTRVTTPDIDDVLKENGVNPYSKEAKVFKESYHMALGKLKAQKG